MTWALIAALLIVAGALVWMTRSITSQLVVIHELVNSNLTTVTANLDITERRIKTLEKHIAEEE